MTAQQALRYGRRRQLELQRKQRARETLLAILTLLFIFAAFAFAGTNDYHDDSLELARWEEQGVTVYRW